MNVGTLERYRAGANVKKVSNSRHSAQRVLPLLVIGACVLSCMALALTVTFLRPRSFTTFSDAIGYVLQQRGIPYERVFLDRTWPDTVNDISYGADLLITLPGGKDATGRLDCRGWKTDCFFTVRAFAIYREPLPELSQQRRLPWVEWLERTVATFSVAR